MSFSPENSQNQKPGKDSTYVEENRNLDTKNAVKTFEAQPQTQEVSEVEAAEPMV